MRKAIGFSMFVLLLSVVFIVGAQENIIGPTLPNNFFFHGADTDGIFRALIGIDENNDILIDADDQDVQFGNSVDVDGNLTVDGTSTLTGAQTLTGNTTMSGDATVGGTLGVTGASTFTGAATANGDLTANAEFHGSQGTDVASANTLTLAGDGTTYLVTGTTQLNQITTTGFQNGSEVVLLFDDAVTIADAQSATGLAAAIHFDSNGNLVTAADTIARFVLTTRNSVRAWRYAGGSK